MGPSKKAPRKPPKNFGRQLVYPAPEFTKEELAWYKVLAEGRKEIDRLLAIREGLVSPPWMKRRQEDEGPQVRFAKELMKAIYFQDEWRTMTIKAVRNGCADEAR